MAKVTGPLFSQSASGAFAGALVFGTWKGRNTVRALVTPSNPKTAKQSDVRNAFSVLASAQSWVSMNTAKRTGSALTDVEALRAMTPSGQAWNGYMVKNGIGTGSIYYAADKNAYTGAVRTAYEAAVAALPIKPQQVLLQPVGLAPAVLITAAEVYYHAVQAMVRAGVVISGGGATPPTYA